MIVHSIDLYSNDRQVLTLNVDRPDVRNPYKLKGISGLDIEEIIPQFYGQGTESETKFYELTLQPREIVIRIGLNPNYSTDQSPGELRDRLLKAIASNRGGKLQVRLNYNDTPIAAIFGFVKRFEAPVSVVEPEVQMTLYCEDPLFKSLYTSQQIVTDLSKTDPLIIDPVSTAPHGFKFRLTFTGSVNPFIIRNSVTPDWQFRIDYAFLNGDQLYFSSENGDKYLYRIRSGITLYLMDKIQAGAVWPILFPGENQFNINTSGFNWNEVYWYETHWGV